VLTLHDRSTIDLEHETQQLALTAWQYHMTGRAVTRAVHYQHVLLHHMNRGYVVARSEQLNDGFPVNLNNLSHNDTARTRLSI